MSSPFSPCLPGLRRGRPDMLAPLVPVVHDAVQVSELATVKDQFGKKYGSEFVKRAEINDGGCVNHKVVEKLQCDPPAGYVITVRIGTPCWSGPFFACTRGSQG